MNIERLTHLRDLLRADAANPVGAKFDLGTWAGWDQNGENQTHFPVNSSLIDPDEQGNMTHDNRVELSKMKPAEVIADEAMVPTMSCNTFVCGLGLAALDPEFNKQGLEFKVVPLHGSPTAWMIPQFEGAEGMDAGANFFEISYEDSQYLFDPDCYDETPKHAEGELFVADRIDNMLNGIVDHAYHPDYKDGDGDDEDRDED